MGSMHSHKAQGIIATIECFSAHHYARFDTLIPAHARGMRIWDVDGRRLLDMAALYSAANIGHNHPRIKKVMQGDYPMVPHRFYTPQEAEALQFLWEVSGMQAGLFMNSGAEAFDTVLKLARKWAYMRKGVPQDKAMIIVANDNFHGRTLAATSASSTKKYKENFGPHAPGFIYVPFGDIEALEKAITSHTAGLILEPIQCEGGIIFPGDSYLSSAKELCKNNAMLYVLDEVQTGLGRTGKMFAYEHWGVQPDILLAAKSIGGGQYPVSVVLASRDIMDTFEPGEHGSTWGGNALACAIVVETLKILQDEDLVRRSAAHGAYFLQKLWEVQSRFIKEVRGLGLLIGIELTPEAGDVDEWCKRLHHEGFLCISARNNVIRLTPPLIISLAQIDSFIRALKRVLHQKENGAW